MCGLLHKRIKQANIVFSALFFLHRLCSWQLSAVKVLVQCFPPVLLAGSLALYLVYMTMLNMGFNGDWGGICGWFIISLLSAFPVSTNG